jgi:hypothetical protein
MSRDLKIIYLLRTQVFLLRIRIYRFSWFDSRSWSALVQIASVSIPDPQALEEIFLRGDS